MRSCSKKDRKEKINVNNVSEQKKPKQKSTNQIKVRINCLIFFPFGNENITFNWQLNIAQEAVSKRPNPKHLRETSFNKISQKCFVTYVFVCCFLYGHVFRRSVFCCERVSIVVIAIHKFRDICVSKNFGKWEKKRRTEINVVSVVEFAVHRSYICAKCSDILYTLTHKAYLHFIVTNTSIFIQHMPTKYIYTNITTAHKQKNAIRVVSHMLPQMYIISFKCFWKNDKND